MNRTLETSLASLGACVTAVAHRDTEAQSRALMEHALPALAWALDQLQGRPAVAALPAPAPVAAASWIDPLLPFVTTPQAMMVAFFDSLIADLEAELPPLPEVKVVALDSRFQPFADVPTVWVEENDDGSLTVAIASSARR